MLDSLDAASFTPEFQLQLCLASGSLIHRITHQLRNIPGGERHLVQEEMNRYHSAVLNVPCRLVHLTELPSMQQQLASLPAHHGGLG